jgi:transcriptional regulator with XRE-family HTH domain
MLGQLRAAREALGLTQGEVGRRLGRGDQFVSKCETGDRRIDPIDLLWFARVYGRPVASFLPTLPDADAVPRLAARRRPGPSDGE